MVSLSGRFSREGAVLRTGYETWRRAVEDAGGIDVGGRRRPVRLTLLDDESDPLTAARQVDRLVDQHGAGLVLGPFSTPITVAAAGSAERRGALFVAPDGGSTSLYERGQRMLVSIVPPDERYFDALIDLVASVGGPANRIAMLVPEEPFFAAAASGAVGRARERGLEIVGLERYAVGQRDVVALLDRLAQAGPGTTLVAGEPETLARFTPQIRELRLATPVRAIVPGPPNRGLVGLVDDVEGALTVDWWSSRLRTGGPLFGSARDFARLFERLHGYPPDARAASAAAAGLALQLGIERAGSPDPRAVRQVLARLEVETFWGRLGWDEEGRNRVATAPVLQVRGGEAVVVFPESLAEERVQVR